MPSMINLSIRVPLSEGSALEEWARDQGTDLSSFCRGILLTALTNYRLDRLKMFQAKERQRERVGS